MTACKEEVCKIAAEMSLNSAYYFMAVLAINLYCDAVMFILRIFLVCCIDSIVLKQ